MSPARYEDDQNVYTLVDIYTYILYYDVDGLRLNFFRESHSGETGFARFLEVSILYTYIYIWYILYIVKIPPAPGEIYTFFFGGGEVLERFPLLLKRTHTYTASYTGSDDLWFAGNFCVYEMFTPSSIYIHAGALHI